MKCNTLLCIFNEQGKCHFDELYINENGMCEKVIMINISKNELSEIKKKKFKAQKSKSI